MMETMFLPIDIHEETTLEQEDDVDEHGSYFMSTSSNPCSYEKSLELIGPSNIAAHKVFNPLILSVPKIFQRVVVDTCHTQFCIAKPSTHICAPRMSKHTHISQICNSIKVKYLLHRISHHKINTKFAQRQYYYNHSGITSPTTTGTPTGEHQSSSPRHPLETLYMYYLLPIRDFH